MNTVLKKVNTGNKREIMVLLCAKHYAMIGYKEKGHKTPYFLRVGVSGRLAN
jgi:hypothetical protein